MTRPRAKGKRVTGKAMLDFVAERGLMFYWTQDGFCFLSGGSVEKYRDWMQGGFFKSPRGAVKAAMKAERTTKKEPRQ